MPSNPPIVLNTTRRVVPVHLMRTCALLASGALVLQSSCLGRIESGLDLVTAPSAIANTTDLPYSPLLNVAEFLLRFWF